MDEIAWKRVSMEKEEIDTRLFYVITLSWQKYIPECWHWASDGVNVNRHTTISIDFTLPATEIRCLGFKGVLHCRFAILQGIGAKRTWTYTKQ